MLVDKLECYRYYSDLAGFDMIITVESGNVENLENKLDDIIGYWYDGEYDICDIPLSDYIKMELEKENIEISLYYCMD